MSSNSECVKEQLPFSIWQRGKFIYRKIIKQYIRASEGITKERHVFNWPSRHNSSLESEWKVSTFICSFSGIFKALIPWGLSIFFFWKHSAQQGLQTDLISLPSLMHTWKHQEINTYTHTSIKTCCGNGYFVPLCRSFPLCCREVRNRIHLHAYPESFADEPPMSCRQLLFFSLFVTLKKCERIQRLKMEAQQLIQKKGEFNCICPFYNHFTES